jgi:hypothetical protein
VPPLYPDHATDLLRARPKGAHHQRAPSYPRRRAPLPARARRTARAAGGRGRSRASEGTRRGCPRQARCFAEPRVGHPRDDGATFLPPRGPRGGLWRPLEQYGLMYEGPSRRLLGLSREAFHALVLPAALVKNPLYSTAPHVGVFEPAHAGRDPQSAARWQDGLARGVPKMGLLAPRADRCGGTRRTRGDEDRERTR